MINSSSMALPFKKAISVALSIVLVLSFSFPVEALAVGQDAENAFDSSEVIAEDSAQVADLETAVELQDADQIVSNIDESAVPSEPAEDPDESLLHVGKEEIYKAGFDSIDEYNAVYGQNDGLELLAQELRPMTFSDEMLYFCKYESSCNYDQGFSSGDGYHALGYFQFDNRYGLGDFLRAVYNYDSVTFKNLKIIGDRYNWDTSGAIRSNGEFTMLGADLEAGWHFAYAQNPTLFSELQNGWAYISYYNGGSGARNILMNMGINIDNRADCAKGLVWGMTNLFGSGGVKKFFINSGINNSMTDTEFVTALCDHVINNVAGYYPNQTQYHRGWQNRYRNEKADCLKFLAKYSGVRYAAHLSWIGWMDSVSSGSTAGSIDSGEQLEALKVNLGDNLKGSVLYRSCVQNSWECTGDDWKSDGEISGTVGESKPVNAIQMVLAGEVAVNYDVYYRVYAQGYGWLGWAKNGETAGTLGYNVPLRGYQVQLVKKGVAAPGTTARHVIDAAKPDISYYVHVQDLGDQMAFGNGEVSGTMGASKRLEAIQIALDKGPYSGDIKYSTHIQNIGWQDWKYSNQLSGTSGKGLRLEAIKIQLEGEIADHYDIYYRVHAQMKGWMGWAKNGQKAGTAGYAYRLEAIQIVLVKKGDPAPGESYNGQQQLTEKAFSSATGDGDVNYTTHVQMEGWQDYVSDGDMAGTAGKSYRLEGIKVNLGEEVPYAGGISYRTHVQNIGWQDFVSNDAMSGTSGKSLRLEAINIKLTGEMEKHYDVYYRVHAQMFGWMGWAKNGEDAGTAGYSYRLEGIQIVLVKKGDPAPSATYKGISQDASERFAEQPGW